MILRRVLVGVVLLVSVVSAQARITRQEYIDKYKAIAVAHQQRYGIPASITMAQGILESDSGNSQLSAQSNNHFGIKCKSSWTGEKVYYDDDAKGECFRAYPTVEQSYYDHAEFLDKSPRYDSLFDLKPTDYKGWATGLKKAGYATAADYAQRLIKIIEANDLYVLDEEDGLAKYAKLHGGSVIPMSDGWFADAENLAIEGVDPDNFATTINGHKGYNVYRNNGVFFVVAKSGDNYEKIAEFFEVSKRRLLSYNDLTRKAQIKMGEVVYIARKRSKYRDEGVEEHVVKSGETMQSVSQEYAIMESSLLRINKLKKGTKAIPGQVLKLK